MTRASETGQSGGDAIADVLSRAADLIEPEGAWVQRIGAADKFGHPVKDGDFDSPVCWCIGGAINQVTRQPASDTEAWAFFESMVGDKPYRWNDAPGRTQQEVVAKLREAAALALGLAKGDAR